VIGHKIFFYGILLALVTSVVSAESEFDFEELMKDVETQIQNVQNSISAQDSATALTDVKKLQDEFKLVEGFFERRGNSADAVLNSKEYQDKAAAIQKSLTAGDYTTAANEANDFSKQCRGACHDKYKPL
jgi:hypothetical protein